MGQLRWGTITAVKKFGAFVDVDGITALLHISQISQERLSSMNNIFRVGERVRALVVSCSFEKQQVNLSTKRFERRPGDMLRNREKVYANADALA